jgi:Ca2+-transporting ATPase
MKERDWYAVPENEALDAVETDLDGFSAEEARERLDTFGENTLKKGHTVSPWRSLLAQFKSPLIYVLLVAFLITVGIDHYADAIVIAIVLMLNAVIGFVQEYRVENAIAALASLVSPKARVRRAGTVREIDNSELVPGDVIIVESGDILSAGVRLIEAADLRLDATILTGESIPVSRTTESVPAETAIADRVKMAYMGTSSRATTPGQHRRFRRTSESTPTAS